MSKRVMGKGRLIRRQTNDGIPIGPWMEIEMSNSKYVYAKSIEDTKEDLVLLDRSHVWIPKIVQLCISSEKMLELMQGKTLCISHNASKQWLKAVDDPDILEFYTSDGSLKLYSTIQIVYITHTFGQKRVIINIDRTL